jgi:hypothetical protein
MFVYYAFIEREVFYSTFSYAKKKVCNWNLLSILDKIVLIWWKCQIRYSLKWRNFLIQYVRGFCHSSVDFKLRNFWSIYLQMFTVL